MPGLLIQVVLLSLASYRVTRFVIDDSLIDGPRDWFKRVVLHQRFDPYRAPEGRVRRKALELIECPYCMSVWISGALTVLMVLTWSGGVAQPFWAWMATCGATMAWWRLIETD